VREPALLGRLILDKIPADVLERLAIGLRDLDFTNPERLALKGDLSVVPLGGVLQMLQVEGQSGVLTIASGERASRSPTGDKTVTVALRGGLVDLVQSKGTDDEFRLGRYFVEEGIVTEDELEALMREDSIPPPVSGVVADGDETPSPPSKKKRLLGDALLQSGKATEPQLRTALVRQSSELVYEVLRWQRGRFEFRRQPLPPLAQRARLGLPMASIVMEGFRRVDEWRILEGVLGSFEDVLVRDEASIGAMGPSATAMQKSEKTVLDAIDGERTIREVIAATHMSSFDVCRALVQFLEARLVRRRGK
jgi:hypothetical protein